MTSLLLPMRRPRPQRGGVLRWAARQSPPGGAARGQAARGVLVACALAAAVALQLAGPALQRRLTVLVGLAPAPPAVAPAAGRLPVMPASPGRGLKVACVRRTPAV